MRVPKGLYGALCRWGLFLCCSGFFLFAARADAEIARFSFITEPQIVPAAEMSGVCTIQAQNVAGEGQQSEETIDLSFSSTSATGEFLGATGEPVRTVMNKGTANRTFYYRDVSIGTHALTVTAIGRVSRQSWTARQQIIVGQAASAPVPSPPAVSAAVPGASAPTSGSIPASSPTSAIESRAGLDRTVIAGASTDFRGTAIGLIGGPIDNARFWWNFGDGAAAPGPAVSHIFRAPGTYTAGLHVSSGIYAASDYVTVTVVPNKVAITEVIGGDAGFIRLRNGSDATVDIGGWIIEAGDGRRFVLPPATMIRGKSDIALTHQVTGLSGVPSLSVRFPDGSPAFVYLPEPLVPKRDLAPVPILSEVAASVPSPSTKTVQQKINADKSAVPLSARDAASSSPPAASAASAEMRQMRQMPESSSGYFFFGLAALLSAGASAVFLFLKRF